MNRNWLKIIALLTMLIDHIGAYLLPSLTWLRMIGRLAFPIFAFFIAEGMKYTKNRQKYILTLLVFAFISQVPYALLGNFYKLNILFTFLISILVIYLIETYKTKELLKMISLMLVFGVLFIVEFFNVVDYGLCGVMLPVVFYFIKDKKLALVLGAGILVVLSLEIFTLSGATLENLKQLISIGSILLLAVYNGQKGKVNLKYLFYVFYPLHLILIYIIHCIA